MRALFAALQYGSAHVRAFDLGVGLGAAVIATSDIPGFLQWVTGGAAVFLLGRELVHHYAFTSAWLRHAKYTDGELRRRLDDWSDEEKKRNLPPLTPDEVEQESRKLQDGEPS